MNLKLAKKIYDSLTDESLKKELSKLYPSLRFDLKQGDTVVIEAKVVAISKDASDEYPIKVDIDCYDIEGDKVDIWITPGTIREIKKGAL